MKNENNVEVFIIQQSNNPGNEKQWNIINTTNNTWTGDSFKTWEEALMKACYKNMLYNNRKIKTIRADGTVHIWGQDPIKPVDITELSFDE